MQYQKKSKINADEIEGSWYKLPRGRDMECVPEPLLVTYKFWSFSPVKIFVKIHLNQVIMKMRVSFSI